MAGFVIEMTHRKTGARRYICAVPATPGGSDYENTPVETLEEARRYPYEDAEVAAYVVTTFPLTKNLTYQVIDLSAKGANAGIRPASAPC
jgi:hypothetical protein